MSIKLKEIQKLIEASLEEFFTNEQDLIDVNANERTISMKIAEYIRPKFSEWDVDCEYNRDNEKPKTDEITGDPVYPDIIIHKRRIKDNLLFMEIKKSGLPYEGDIAKIKSFTSSSKYSYKFGLMLIINIGSEPSKKYDWIWFP